MEERCSATYSIPRGLAALVHARSRVGAATASSEGMMAAFEKVAGGQPDEPLGYLVVDEGGSKRNVPIFDQLFVGRECAAISERRRLVIDDPEISRTHLEIRLDAASDQAFVVDTSSNGTSLNGVRLERALLLPIRPGDEIPISEPGSIPGTTTPAPTCGPRPPTKSWLASPATAPELMTHCTSRRPLR
jgi:hypothetical protein